MSGVLTIPNAFTNAVTATGAQLDADFNSVTAYINNPTNRNNYGADTGGTNTIAISFSPAVAGFTGGLELTFKSANTNTGGVVLIPNSVGTRTIVNADGSALSAGQIQAGSVYKAIDDGTRAIFLAPAIPATQAQMQTATAAATFLTPANAKYHHGIGKAAGWFNGTETGTITTNALVNVTSIARAGVGTWSVALTNAFADTRFVVLCGAPVPTAGLAIMQEVSRTTIGFVIGAYNASTTAVDIVYGSFEVYGLLP